MMKFIHSSRKLVGVMPLGKRLQQGFMYQVFYFQRTQLYFPILHSKRNFDIPR